MRWSVAASAIKPSLVAVRDEADQARYIVEQILKNREEGSRAPAIIGLSS